MSATLPRLEIAPGDQLSPVAKVAERLTGQRPHPTTVCRWVRKGSAGVVLPSVIVAGKRMTSPEAFGAWIREVTDRRNAQTSEG